jgi:hypothetical protein
MSLFGRRKPEVSDERSTDNETEMLKGGLASATTTLRDLLIVTYAVPVAKAQALLPDGLPLDKLPGPDGELTAFAQTLVAYYKDARWSPLPGTVGTSFHQIAYRLLVRRDGKRGAFELRTFTSDAERHITQRALNREADYARMSLYIDGNPARGTYRTYTIRAAGDTGKTELDAQVLLEAPAPPVPFGSREDMVAFLTARDEIYFRAAAPKERVSVFPLQMGAFAPVYGELIYARLTPWTDSGLLTAEEQAKPLSVLIQSAVPLISRPPRLTKFSPAVVPT